MMCSYNFLLYFLLIRFIILSCGAYVDEIHYGMLALLSQVMYFGQALHKHNIFQSHYSYCPNCCPTVAGVIVHKMPTYLTV
jgi:hypothetical protein